MRRFGFTFVALFCALLIFSAAPVGAAQTTWRFGSYSSYIKNRPVAKRPLLREGKKGEAVHALQLRLIVTKFALPGSADGTFSVSTRDSVIAFQKYVGLEADGVVGKKTWKALDKMKKAPKAPKGQGTYAAVDLQKQLAFFVRNGKTLQVLHVSTGATDTPTPTGSFKVFRKEVQSWSIEFEQWLPFASYFNNGVAFHGYDSVPVYPASHSCVRVPQQNAAYAYGFLALNTTVHVY